MGYVDIYFTKYKHDYSIIIKSIIFMGYVKDIYFTTTRGKQILISSLFKFKG